jgi:hypothetical protein
MRKYVEYKGNLENLHACLHVMYVGFLQRPERGPEHGAADDIVGEDRDADRSEARRGRVPDARIRRSRRRRHTSPRQTPPASIASIVAARGISSSAARFAVGNQRLSGSNIGKNAVRPTNRRSAAHSLLSAKPSQLARRDYARCGAGTAGRRRRKVSRRQRMKMAASSEIFLFGEFRLDRAGGRLFRRELRSNGPRLFAGVTGKRVTAEFLHNRSTRERQKSQTFSTFHIRKGGAAMTPLTFLR